MTRWQPAAPAAAARINSALEQYLKDNSPARLLSMKEAVRAAFPGLSVEDQGRLEKAAGIRELANLFASVLDGSRRVHFRVRTLFRKADDDKTDDDDDDEVPDSLDVVTPFGDCGNDFQIGETYLVYANSDEETEWLSTDACSRTRRASDAGADLAYLSFYKDRKHPSGRVQGFATNDIRYQSRPREAERIPLPAEGVIVALRSDHAVRYTATNQFGQFVFDGLDAGEYSLTAYAAGFPDATKVLSGPLPFRLDARACSTQILVIVGA
ncbi:MAG TPA: carboxypeptidase-like regulatory domain-containing protein, partial [Tepidisphaeraceae bacterium]